MGSRTDLRKALYDRLVSQHAVEYGSVVPVHFENQKFEQPKSTPFMIAWIAYNDSKRASIGTQARFVRHTGFFNIDCLVPEESGVQGMLNLAEAVERCFAEDHFTLEDGSYATMLNPKVRGHGSQDGFYYCTVMVPFIMDAAGV